MKKHETLIREMNERFKAKESKKLQSNFAIEK
jgi:hypothetical protein